MHLADALSKVTYSAFRLYMYCQYVYSLGIEPTTFTLLTQCSTTEPQGHYIIYITFAVPHGLGGSFGAVYKTEYFNKFK